MDITTASFVTHEVWYSLAAVVTFFGTIVVAFAVTLFLGRKIGGTNTLGFFSLLPIALAIIIGGMFLFTVFASAASERVSEEEANIEGRAEFEHGITELSPLDGSINACVEGSDRDAAAYAWTAEEGDKVTGHITKTAETDGECVYTFIVHGAGT